MHTLVIGGTRMLTGTTQWLAEQGHVVSVVSRKAGWLLDKGSASNLNHVAVDYRDSDVLRQRIAEAIAAHGRIELAVFWIHTDAPDAFRVIVDVISGHTRAPWTLLHVRGSAAYLRPESPLVPSNCWYRQVILGFVTEEDGSRWLTNEEISNGVIEAIRSDRERTVVGTLEPWENRPM